MKVAIIAAVTAALVASTGTYAASGWINGSQIRPGTIRISRLTPGAIVKLRGDRGPAGATGAQGQTGPQGPQGIPGTSYTFTTDSDNCLLILTKAPKGFLPKLVFRYCP